MRFLFSLRPVREVYFLVMFIFIIPACSETDKRKSFSTPMEYNDYIMTELNEIDQWYNDQILQVKDAASARKFCLDIERKTERGIVKLSIQPFEGDSSLCEETKGFFTFLKTMSRNELRMFFKLVYNQTNTSDSKNKIAELIGKMDGEYSKWWSSIKHIQKVFASKHHLNIVVHKQ